MNLYLFTIGCISILGQVVVLRELNTAFFGVELIYILAIGSWLLWTAAGASIFRHTPHRPDRVGRKPAVDRLRWLLVVFGPLLLADVAFVRALRPILGGVSGTYLPFGLQLLGIALALLPIGLTLGLAFQWAAKLHVAGVGRSLAGAYAIESFGGIIGGILATAAVVAGWSNVTTALLCAAASAAAAVGRTLRRGPTPAAATVMGLLVAALTASPTLDRWMTSWTHPDVIESRDSPYGRITLAGRQGQFVVYEDDALSFDTEGTGAEEFAHLAVLQHPAPQRVLVAGGGVEGLIFEIRKHGDVRIDYVEINPVLLELARARLPAAFRAAGARVIVADPRSFLKQADAYDLILCSMPEPTSGRTNRFFTREFFRLCARKLSPGGIFAFRLPSSENLWTPLLAFRNASIHRALTAEFDDVVVLPGVVNTVIAADRPLTREPAVLVERFDEKQIASRLVTGDYIRYLYTNDRFAGIERRLASTEAPINSDRRPVCYQFSSVIWLSQFLPGLIHAAPERWMPSMDGLLALAAGLFLLAAVCRWMARRRPMLRRAAMVAVAGLLGMVLETLLILHYQVKSGALYQNIGLLLTAFMTGLAAGAGLLSLLRRAPSPWIGRATAAGFAGLGLMLARLLILDGVSGLAVVGGLLFLSGLLVAALFGYASLLGLPDQTRVVSPLYAADLVGGCLGAVAASLWLIPFFGMDPTAYLVVWMAVVLLVLV